MKDRPESARHCVRTAAAIAALAWTACASPALTRVIQPDRRSSCRVAARRRTAFRVNRGPDARSGPALLSMSPNLTRSAVSNCIGPPEVIQSGRLAHAASPDPSWHGGAPPRSVRILAHRPCPPQPLSFRKNRITASTPNVQRPRARPKAQSDMTMLMIFLVKPIATSWLRLER